MEPAPLLADFSRSRLRTLTPAHTQRREQIARELLRSCVPDWREKISNGNLLAELLRNHAAHHSAQILARLLQHKRISRLRPPEFKTRRERRNPDFADRSVRRNHKLRFFRLLKNHFQLPALA